MSGNPYKILMISKALVIGAYHKKLEEMARLGIELHVIVPTHYGNQRPEILQGNGYAIHQLRIALSGKNHFHFYPQLRKYIAEIHPDILHIDEESYSFVTYHAMQCAVQYNIPALFFNWQNIYKRYPWPFSGFERYVFSHAAAGIAGSEEVKNVLLKKKCSRIPLQVIPQFGVDTGMYKPYPEPELRRSCAPGSARIIGFAGRFVEEKGILGLLQAAVLLPADHHLMLLGSGPQQPGLEKRIRSLGLQNRVHILGSIKSMEMPRYLNVMDCLVLPSLTRPNWKEQFGRILIEAMACAVPVIGSDSGEIPHVIGDAGFIFPEGNSVKLAECICTMLSDEFRRKQRGEAGRVRVETYFTQEKIARETLALYRMILDRKAVIA